VPATFKGDREPRRIYPRCGSFAAEAVGDGAKLDPKQEWQLYYASTADRERAVTEGYEQNDPDIGSYVGACLELTVEVRNL
jgi:hypothetical protein